VLLTSSSSRVLALCGRPHPFFAHLLHPYQNPDLHSFSSTVLAKEAIILCANAIRQNKSHMATHPARLIVNMATRLAFLWGFRFFPSIVTQEIAYQYFKNHNMQSFAARLAKMLVELFSEKMLSQALSIATGVEMCRLFIEIRMKAIGKSLFFSLP
jgi:hypothetical protein